MIQRIQTLWLFLVFCGTIMLFMVPVITMHSESTMGVAVDGSLNLIAKSNPEMLSQIENGGNVVLDQTCYFKPWGLVALAIITAIMTMVSIFMFKNRILQVRLVSLTFLVNVIYVFLLMFWAMDKYNTIFQQFATNMGCDSVEMHYGLGVWIPLLSIVLLLLAQRGIKKDEAKVRAADRLR